MQNQPERSSLNFSQIPLLTNPLLIPTPFQSPLLRRKTSWTKLCMLAAPSSSYNAPERFASYPPTWNFSGVAEPTGHISQSSSYWTYEYHQQHLTQLIILSFLKKIKKTSPLDFWVITFLVFFAHRQPFLLSLAHRCFLWVPHLIPQASSLFIQSCDFEHCLYSNNLKIYTCPQTSPLNTQTVNSLLGISPWKSNWYLKFNMYKTELLIFPKIFLQFCLSQ